MGISSDILNRLAALQLAPEAMQEVLSIIASCIEPQEMRRRRDRDRKRAEIPRKFRGNDDGNSAETVTEIPPMHITTPQVQKPKRVSVCIDASEIPEKPTEEASKFALSKGWDKGKAEGEWQRFRDHSLSKGRKHRNLLAAWRNWVTSPFQSNGAQNGARPSPDRSTSAAAGRILERIRSLNAPLSEN